MCCFRPVRSSLVCRTALLWLLHNTVCSPLGTVGGRRQVIPANKAILIIHAQWQATGMTKRQSTYVHTSKAFETKSHLAYKVLEMVLRRCIHVRRLFQLLHQHDGVWNWGSHWRELLLPDKERNLPVDVHAVWRNVKHVYSSITYLFLQNSALNPNRTVEESDEKCITKWVVEVILDGAVEPLYCPIKLPFLLPILTQSWLTSVEKWRQRGLDFNPHIIQLFLSPLL